MIVWLVCLGNPKVLNTGPAHRNTCRLLSIAHRYQITLLQCFVTEKCALTTYTESTLIRLKPLIVNVPCMAIYIAPYKKLMKESWGSSVSIAMDGSSSIFIPFIPYKSRSTWTLTWSLSYLVMFPHPHSVMIIVSEGSLAVQETDQQNGRCKHRRKSAEDSRHLVYREGV